MNYLDILLQQKYNLETNGKKPTVIQCNAFVLEQLRSQVLMMTDNRKDVSLDTIMGLKIKIDDDKELEVI